MEKDQQLAVLQAIGASSKDKGVVIKRQLVLLRSTLKCVGKSLQKAGISLQESVLFRKAVHRAVDEHLIMKKNENFR